MKPCVSQATTLSASFDEDLRGYSEVGCGAIEVWLTKLEKYLEERSIEQVKDLVSEQDVVFAAAAIQGGVLFSQGDAQRESITLFQRRLELCRALSIPTLVVLADFWDEVSQEDYRQVLDSLKGCARRAADCGVRLAVEFSGQARFCNNLETAAQLVSDCAQPNVGICLDVFHFYIGPSKFEDLQLLGRDNLFHVQVCDLAGIPRELAKDADRVLPGDGDFDLKTIIDHLRSVGFDDYVSVELMNPQIWQLPPAQVAEVAITALLKLLGLSEGSRQ